MQIKLTYNMSITFKKSNPAQNFGLPNSFTTELILNILCKLQLKTDGRLALMENVIVCEYCDFTVSHLHVYGAIVYYQIHCKFSFECNSERILKSLSTFVEVIGQRRQGHFSRLAVWL